MHKMFALAVRLLSPLIVFGICGVCPAQTDDNFGGFRTALACPENVRPTAAANAGSGGGGGPPAFDYSLLRKKHQQLASQNRRSPLSSLSVQTPGANPSRFGPLTGQQKKLLLRAEADDAPRYAVASSIHEKGEEAYDRWQPAEPQIEAPMPPPHLSTALGAHAQAPLQMQTAKATTGLATGAGPLFTSNTAARAARVRRASGRSPSRALTIVGRFRSGCR